MTPEEQPPPSAAGWSLLSLVDELLLSIIDHIESHETLCTLAAVRKVGTCSRLQGLVEPYCWRSLLVTKGRHADKIAFSLNNRVERIAFIQDLAIRYDDRHEVGIENLGGFMPHMEKLRHLTIESPCPNNSNWRGGAIFDSWTRIDYTTLFETAAMPMLQSFTLHGHPSESRQSTFGKTAIIFFHPTLRNITISCTDFNAGVSLDSIAPEKLKSTPLQSLTLIECNVYVRFLDVVLSLPRALKELSIGERLHVFQDKPSFDPKDRTTDSLFLDALRKQSDSLERLVHCGGHPRYLPRPSTDDDWGTKLRTLQSLQHLEIGFESCLNRGLMQNGCPDSLKTLRLSDHALVPTQSDLTHMVLEMAEAMGKRIPNTTDLEILYNYNAFAINRAMSLEHIWGHPSNHERRKQVYTLAKALKSRGSRLRIFEQKFKGGTSFIPPYMYGEDTPFEVLQYDSKDFWTFLGISHQSYDEELLEKPELVEAFVKARAPVPTTEADW